MSNNPAVKLTPAQLAARWAGQITTGTLANWRSSNKGPDFEKLGTRVVYPIEAVLAYEEKNRRSVANDNGVANEK